MKIQNHIPINSPYNKAAKADENSSYRNPRNGPTTNNSQDKVQLSSQAKEMVAAVRALKSIPDVASDKVQKVKSAIIEGTYAIEPDKIAHDMLIDSITNQIALKEFVTNWYDRQYEYSQYDNSIGSSYSQNKPPYDPPKPPLDEEEESR